MRKQSSGRKWLALVATLAVFAVVLAVANRPLDSAPLPQRTPVTMLGGSPARNLVNLVDRNMPTTWDLSKEQNVRWSTRLGSKAYAGPIIFGGKIFIGTNNGQPRNPKIKGDKGVLMCFEEKTGKFLWQAVHDKLAAGRVNDWPEEGVISTPAVEGDRLYYVSNRCEVVCATTDGKKSGDADIVWRLDMIGQLKVFPHNASTSSPLLVGDLLFVVTGNGVDAYHINLPSPLAPSFLAIDKRNGKVVWQNNSPGMNVRHGQWSSPVFAQVAHTPMVVFPGGDGWLYAFDPPTGKLLWRFDCNPKAARFVLGPRSTWNHFVGPPVVADKRLYIGVGEDPEHLKGVGHLWCIDLARAVEKGRTNPGRDVSPVDDNFDPLAPANKNSALAWHFGGMRAKPKKRERPFIFGRTLSTCAVHDGLVYAAEFDGWLHCLDARTGEQYWDHNLDSDTWSSPYWVDGKVYLANESGEVFVFEHGKKKKLLSTVETNASHIRATPIAANGVLYLVTENPCKLYALRAPLIRSETTPMHYDYIAIPDAEVPVAVDPTFQHVVDTYVSETNKTASMWKAVPDDKLEFRPHEKTNSLRKILIHQLFSERRFFAQFVATVEPAVEELLPAGDNPDVAAYLERYLWLARRRLPQLAANDAAWWLTEQPFFGGLQRQRIWTFWRRVLHTAHHRTQVQTWLRLAGCHVPTIYGPSGDVKWDEADPTYSLAAARRG